MNIDVLESEFEAFLIGLANSGDYQYKFLRHEVRQAMEGKSRFYESSVLNIQGEGWILIIHSEAILAYGSNWSKSQLEEIKTGFDMTKCKNYLITGDSYLIKALIQCYGIDNFQMEMERLFYKTNAITIFSSNDLNISRAGEKDLIVLAAMLQQYYHQEYE